MMPKMMRRRCRFTSSLQLPLHQAPRCFTTCTIFRKRAGVVEDAFMYLKKYAALKPGDAPAQLALGDMLYDRKDNAGALAAYRAVLKADPTAKGFYKKYVELVTKNGTRLEITSALNGAIAANEADAGMYIALGDIYKGEALCTKAIPLYNKASQLDPKNGAVLTSLAECQAKSGSISDAVVTLEQALAMNPGTGKDYKTLGDLYMQQKKTESAITAFKKYLEKNTNNAIARLVGEAAFKNKNYAEAEKYFGMVTGADAEATDLLSQYAQAAYESKDDIKAIMLYKQLAVLKTAGSQVFYRLYDLSARSGTKDDALNYLRKYVAIKPSDAAAQRALGDILYDRKDEAGALGAYRAVLVADPAAKGFYQKYVELVMKKGTKPEITRALNGAITANEADVKMYIALADIYKGEGLCVNSVPLYQKAMQLDPKIPRS